jgi:uncharacterized membrane protein YgdD (TMEM256/DUF423 family)
MHIPLFLRHAVALLAIASSPKAEQDATVAKLWVGGTVLFSGSIYGLSLGGPKLLGLCCVLQTSAGFAQVTLG